MLLDAGADANARDDEGVAPLATAAQTGHLDVVATLLAAGADADTKDIDGGFPLMLAAAMGHTDIVKLLLTHGCNVDAVNDLGNTALVCATDFGRHECIRLLIRQGGASTAIRSGEDGRTALEIASKVGRDVQTIRELRRVCGGCGKTLDQNDGKFNKCAACQAAYYCSRTCQQADWPKHKDECARMRAAAAETAVVAVAKAAVPHC
jgi:hypothetical protein